MYAVAMKNVKSPQLQQLLGMRNDNLSLKCKTKNLKKTLV